MPTIKITVPGAPMGKPRQTRRDKWAQRDCVMKYRSWSDLLRLCAMQQAGPLPDANSILHLSWVAYFTPPAKHLDRIGRLHRICPDRDNIDKAVLDSLFKQDQGIAAGSLEKRWDCEARLEITIEYEEESASAVKASNDVYPRISRSTGIPAEGQRQGQIHARLGGSLEGGRAIAEPVPEEHAALEMVA